MSVENEVPQAAATAPPPIQQQAGEPETPAQRAAAAPAEPWPRNDTPAPRNPDIDRDLSAIDLTSALLTAAVWMFMEFIKCKARREGWWGLGECPNCSCRMLF
ncbi:hypothetical protein Dda_5832 [Drechslerella dactyloides]|uniref:Uncharacterized protein n=1 Tax=Drechslerella dactyloides TaxID=74499 RepID=A0AAD6NI19_DREDA|nr:hypothetical protein Dda_5832 [Drechslerella dactyloides]